MSQPATLTQVQNAMERTLAKTLGVTVEVTNRSETEWTISGQPAAVESAVAFLAAHRLMTETSREYDAELGELFVYVRNAA